MSARLRGHAIQVVLSQADYRLLRASARQLGICPTRLATNAVRQLARSEVAPPAVTLQTGERIPLVPEA